MFSHRVKVAVLRGGPSQAYDDSLKTGAYVLELLRQMPEVYEPLDILISRDGEWHYMGLPQEPYKILSRADAVWNAVHGDYGEDGQVQQLFQNLNLPFVGSGVAASAFAHNKEMAKKLYRDHGLLTPASHVLTQESLDDDLLVEIFRAYLHPVIIKPATGVGGVGVKLAHTFHELKEAIARAFTHTPKVLIEEYVRGTISTCSVIEEAKGESLYALVPTHVETEMRRVRPCPEENRAIEKMAKEAHQALGLRHYSSSDFVVTPRGKIYILETNSLPVFHGDSLLHRSLEASGWQPADFADHCLKLALRN